MTHHPREPPEGGIYLVFTDAMRLGLKEWIASGRNPALLRTPQDYIVEALLETLTDSAVRHEVHERLSSLGGLDHDLSMMDVHVVMDGLVSVLYPTIEDPTTTEEQDLGRNSQEAGADEP